MFAGDVEVGVTPGPEVTAATQRLTGIAGCVFACMVDESNGSVESTREFSKGREDSGDLASVVFVGRLKAHVGVEYQKLGLMAGKGETQPLEVLVAVESEGSFHDEPDIEGGEVGFTCEAEAFDAPPYLVGRVFCGEQENRPRAGHPEAPQTRQAGGDGDRDLQSQPGFAGFRSPTNDANRTGTPQRFDQPRLFILWLFADLRSAGDAQLCYASHR